MLMCLSAEVLAELTDVYSDSFTILKRDAVHRNSEVSKTLFRKKHIEMTAQT